MNDDDLQELRQLRKEVEAYRERERADLIQRAAQSQAAADHYRQEAQRNADIGRQIAAEYERKIVELKAKVEFYERHESESSRPARYTGR